MNTVNTLLYFASHEGLYRYKHLIYDISNAFENSQSQIEIAISGCNKAKNISDNILIWRNTLEKHNENLKNIFQRINRNGLRINFTKYTSAV